MTQPLKSELMGSSIIIKVFLNQARAGLHAWFLEIAFVWEVSMRVCGCVCVRPQAMKTSGMI